MEKEQKSEWTEGFARRNLRTLLKMGLENLHEATGLLMKENLKIIRLKALAGMFEMIIENILGNGPII
jgi:hypothetical protein